MPQADVARLCEESAGKGAEPRGHERIGTGLRGRPLNVDNLIGRAQRELACDIQGVVIAVHGQPATQLPSIELVPGSEGV